VAVLRESRANGGSNSLKFLAILAWREFELFPEGAAHVRGLGNSGPAGNVDQGEIRLRNQTLGEGQFHTQNFIVNATPAADLGERILDSLLARSFC